MKRQDAIEVFRGGKSLPPRLPKTATNAKPLWSPLPVCPSCALVVPSQRKLVGAARFADLTRDPNIKQLHVFNSFYHYTLLNTIQYGFTTDVDVQSRALLARGMIDLHYFTNIADRLQGKRVRAIDTPGYLYLYVEDGTSNAQVVKDSSNIYQSFFTFAGALVLLLRPSQRSISLCSRVTEPSLQ